MSQVCSGPHGSVLPLLRFQHQRWWFGLPCWHSLYRNIKVIPSICDTIKISFCDSEHLGHRIATPWKISGAQLRKTPPHRQQGPDLLWAVLIHGRWVQGWTWGCHSLITAPQKAAHQGNFPSWDREAELGADPAEPPLWDTAKILIN